MSAHTPGPWKVVRGHEGYDVHSPEGIVTDNGGSTMADAILMAAAPELLEALRLALHWIPANHFHPTDEDRAMGATGRCPACNANDIRAAIAKAEGKADG